MNASEARCSLCSRDFSQKDVRQSPNGPLCHPCWTVICSQPWPKDDTAHGGAVGTVYGGTRPDALAVANAAAQEAAEAAQVAHKLSMQRRSLSMANIHGIAVPGRNQPYLLPNSMPEAQAGMLSVSAEDPRWGALQHQNQQHYKHHAGSAPAWRHQSSSIRQPPAFSPVELRNMMHEESLELFESQSHLLDPESRNALRRQREYLQWQNSVEEPGPMQSVLERQESAGSGCHDGDGLVATAAAALAAQQPIMLSSGGRGYRNLGPDHGHSGEETSSGGNADDLQKSTPSQPLLHELQETKRHLALVSREREALLTRVHQLEAELQAQTESTLCKMCRKTPRNCVVLPCLHFTACDTCFKQYCVSTLSCPICSGRVTGFQTLLML